MSDDDPLHAKKTDHTHAISKGGENESSDDDHAESSKTKAKKPARKFKKAPGAPKRFRSAFILFSQYKHKAIQEELAQDLNTEKAATTSIAKMVSEAWKTMDAEEREKWEAKARMDRTRFEKEKAKYRGPRTVPIGHRKSKGT